MFICCDAFLNILWFASSRHFVMSDWSSCMRSRISFLMMKGTTILSPPNSSLLTVHSVRQTFLGLLSWHLSCRWVTHPLLCNQTLPSSSWFDSISRPKLAKRKPPTCYECVHLRVDCVNVYIQWQGIWCDHCLFWSMFGNWLVAHQSNEYTLSSQG